jgi:hypothetical protein
MPMMAPHSEIEDVLIPLTGGSACRASVWSWMVEASFRLTFSALPDGRLHVAPRSAITSADATFIRTHKAELVAAVRYCDQMAERPL